MNENFDFEDYYDEGEYSEDGDDYSEEDPTVMIKLSDDPNDSYYYVLHDVVDYNGKDYAVLIPQYGDYTEARLAENLMYSEMSRVAEAQEITKGRWNCA